MALHDLAPFVARWRRAWGGPAEAGQEGFDVVDQRLRGSRGLTRITRRPASRSSRATRPARRSRAAQAAFALRRIGQHTPLSHSWLEMGQPLRPGIRAGCTARILTGEPAVVPGLRMRAGCSRAGPCPPDAPAVLT